MFTPVYLLSTLLAYKGTVA